MSSSSRYQRVEDFGLTRTRLEMEDYIADLPELLAGIDPRPTLRRYQITRNERTVHAYNISVPSRTYIVTSAFLMYGEAQNSGRTTSMRLHQMILSNFVAKGGEPRNLANIAFTKITNSAVQQAINQDYRDLCQMDNVPPTSEVITFAPHYFTDWQARINRNPFLKCVVHVLEEVNRRNPGLNHQIREVRYSAVDNWTNVDYGYHMAVSLGPSTDLAPIRPSERQQQQTAPPYYRQGYQNDPYDQYQGYSQPSYGGGYNVATQNYSNVTFGQWY